jgi:hypothetical protein
MAERIAKFLVDSGLVEWNPTNASELTGLFSYADDLINTITGKGAIEPDLATIHDHYAMAEFLRSEDHWGTAKWFLEKKIIAPPEIVLGEWDEASEMFLQAQGHIQNADPTSECLVAENLFEIGGEPKIPSRVANCIQGSEFTCHLLAWGRY